MTELSKIRNLDRDDDDDDETEHLLRNISFIRGEMEYTVRSSAFLQIHVHYWMFIDFKNYEVSLKMLLTIKTCLIIIHQIYMQYA